MRTVRTVSLRLILLLAILLIGLGLLALEGKPLVSGMAAPTSNDVIEARAFASAARASDEVGDQPRAPLITAEAQLNSVLRLVSRFTPGFRGTLSVGETEIEGKASLPVPYTREAIWLNISASAPGFDEALSLSRVKLGRIPLPPGLALEAMRRSANLVIGDDFGDRLLGAASRMIIEQDRLILNLDIDGVGDNRMMRRLFGTLRGADMPDSRDIDRYYFMIRDAMDRGALPSEGSYLPYLDFTLKAAVEGSGIEGGLNAYTSALFALTYACGAKDFTLVVGDMLGRDADASQAWQTDCSQLTLNGRVDTRRHFTTAAALQAASNRGFSVTVGELKELYDVLESGGFDFTDIAANNAGIRMSQRFMSSPVQDWPALIAQIESENDVIMSFDDIPQIMSEQDFIVNFGSIESSRYRAMLDKIEAKIDQRRLHSDGLLPEQAGWF